MAPADTPTEDWKKSREEPSKRGDTAIEGLAISEKGQELLAALIGFIQPIIRACTPAAVTLIKVEDDPPPLDVQDRKLLDALKSFVKSAVLVQEVTEERTLHEDTQILGDIPSPEILTMTQPHGIPDVEIQEKIMKFLRQRVFNTLPIRMLAFDSTGSGIRLIDRNMVINIVFQQACMAAGTPEFSKKYSESFWDRNAVIRELVKERSSYAILSHTWIRDTPGDVVYGDWNTRTENPRGYAKIAKFCEVAAQNYGVTLGWMDTVCINKESSSELDESIRSMYKWYRESHICVAYMSETDMLESMYEDPWFTRGWTLQELLAPRYIEFYNKDWVTLEYMDPLPFNTSGSVQQQIEEATTITAIEIAHCRNGRSDLIPISRKFELAANRNVTRAEDEIYSLMGLLDVDMSVAYGEGAERALYRLQREILTTKKNPLDIFNCCYNSRNKILPFALFQYKSRTKAFTSQDSNMASALDLWTPAKPLLCTHLGVRMQVLLIPGIDQCVTIENYMWTPKGNIYGKAIVELEMFLEQTYFLLHKDIYINKFTPRWANNRYPPILHFGIINFTVKNNYIVLLNTCLAVPLDCGTTPAGTVTQSDVKICWTGQVPTFHLNSVNGPTGLAIKDLESNGMQLVTLYL